MKNAFLVLGMNYGGHDTSASLMLDGELIAACEQERYTLDKHSRLFPTDAVEDALSLAGAKLDDVDELAFSFDPIHHIREAYLNTAIKDVSRIEFLINDIGRIEENFYIENTIRRNIGYEGPIKFYNHHKCHLASAYYPSGYEESLLVSYDGIGEFETGMMAVGRSGEIGSFIPGNSYPDSLGLIYSAITHYLGWRHHCDEGIIMGLATYGNPDHTIPDGVGTYQNVFDEIIRETGDLTYEINREWISYHQVRDKWVSDKFLKTFGPKRNFDDPVSQHHMDIASALQSRLETVVINQLRCAKRRFKVDHLCLSGGVGLNCSLNGKIEQEQIFDSIFVPPASGDAGAAIGSCYLATKAQVESLKPRKVVDFYLGSRFSTNQICEAFAARDLEPATQENLYEVVADRLAMGKIVGWFQGRAEFGPRALGNRSILTRPYPAEMKDYLNLRVKFREEFRPFAPAVLYSHLEDYFEIRQESPHMLIACGATDVAKEKIPATVHSDNSCRVQSVRPENNSRFFALLTAFYKKTQCPVLLNTSFNVKGQPIVNTPLQAIDCYLSTNIDCLVVGDYFIEKN